MKVKQSFLHYYDATQDTKLQNILMEHGVSGLGVFWYIVEQLYKQGGSMSLQSIKTIAYALHTDEELVRSIIVKFGLFKYNEFSFWSESINKQLEKKKKVSESKQRSVEVRWKKRESKSKPI